MHTLKSVFACYLLLLATNLIGQSARYESNHRAIQYIQSWDVKDTTDHNIHTGLKYYNRKEVTAYAQTKNQNSSRHNPQTQFILNDNEYFLPQELKSEDNKGIFKLFYKSKANFLKLEKKNFSLYINPILNLRFGEERESDYLRFTNTRGIEIHGTIDDKIYFYTNILESQGNFHNFLEQRRIKHKAIPGYSFFKPFTSSVSDKFIGQDYANASGYIGVPISKHVNIELGHGRHFIGHGYQSLLLSEYANNYFYLKLNTKIWKFHYQNLWMELSPISTRLNPMDFLLPKKFMAAHYLSFKPIKNMEIGLFESVVFSRLNDFEFHYLNPVILYRAVEYYLDSPDNVMLGLNAKWNIFKTLSLYGQLAIDDIKFSEVFENNGWWGNKFGIQAGIFYPEAFNVSNLDIRAEANIVRPYTYSHRDSVPEFDGYSIANYSSYNQTLAHPLGANFIEFIGIIDYQLKEKFHFKLKLMNATQGRSTATFNAGEDPLIPNGTRNNDFGVSFLQGNKTTINSIEFVASYEFYHNYFVDLHLLKRSENFPNQLDTNYFGIGLRANMAMRFNDY